MYIVSNEYGNKLCTFLSKKEATDYIFNGLKENDQFVVLPSIEFGLNDFKLVNEYYTKEEFSQLSVNDINEITFGYYKIAEGDIK